MATRRTVLLGGSAALASACAPAPKRGADLTARFAALETTLDGGRLGVCAIDAGSGARLAHRGDERFALASTFKWLLAAAILMAIDAGGARLEQEIHYGQADILGNAPAATAHLGDGGMTIAQLLEAIITVSDNTAANLLLASVQGPEGLTQFLRASSDDVTRLDRIEPELNANAPDDPRDTTTPIAMAQTLRNILVGGDSLAGGQVLSLASRDRLTGWMEKTATGLKRVRAGFPANWRAGDKTGTGANGALNDCVIAWPATASRPARQPIVIASYISGGAAGPETREALHAEIGRLIAQAWG